MTPSINDDAIDVLLTQHQQIKQAFARVAESTGAAKADAFAELQALLRAHELGEQDIIHPATRNLAGEGDVADGRVAEELEADEALAQLAGLGISDGDFDARLAELQAAVLTHAEHEENEEFPALRRALTPEQLGSLGAQLLAAEAQAG